MACRAGIGPLQALAGGRAGASAHLIRFQSCIRHGGTLSDLSDLSDLTLRRRTYICTVHVLSASVVKIKPGVVCSQSHMFHGACAIALC
jgi:hypothetical protein